MIKVGLTIGAIILCAIIGLYTYSWLFEDSMSDWCRYTLIGLWGSIVILEFCGMAGSSNVNTDGL